MSYPRPSLAVDAPDCSAASEPPPRPSVAPAVLAKLRGVQRTLAEGAIGDA